jgi:hypothetical protein
MGDEFVAEHFPHARGREKSAPARRRLMLPLWLSGRRPRYAPAPCGAARRRSARTRSASVLEEFAPRRGVVVEVGDLDHRAASVPSAAGLDAAESLRSAGRRALVPGCAAGDGDPRDAGDRCQRLAAKAVAGDAFEVVEAGDLARGMPRQCQRQVVGRDAAPSSATRIRRTPPSSSCTSIFARRRRGCFPAVP